MSVASDLSRLFSHRVYANGVQVDRLNESVDSPPVAAIRASRKPLAQRQDHPQQVWEAEGGYVVTGRKVAILVEHSGSMKVRNFRSGGIKQDVQRIISQHESIESAAQAVADYVRTTSGVQEARKPAQKDNMSLGDKAKALFKANARGAAVKEDFNAIVKCLGGQQPQEAAKLVKDYVAKVCETRTLPNDARLPVVLRRIEKLAEASDLHGTLIAATRLFELTGQVYEADQLGGWAARYVPDADKYGTVKASLIERAKQSFTLAEDEADAMGALPQPLAFRLLQGSLPSDPGVNGMLAAMNVSDANLGELMKAAEQVPESALLLPVGYGTKQHERMMRAVRSVSEEGEDFPQQDALRMIEYKQREAEIQRRAAQYQKSLQRFGPHHVATPAESVSEGKSLTYEVLECSPASAELLTGLLNARGYGEAWECQYNGDKVALHMPASLANAACDYLAGKMDAAAFENAIGNPWAGKEGTLRLVRYTGSQCIIPTANQQTQTDLEQNFPGEPNDAGEGPEGEMQTFLRGGGVAPVAESDGALPPINAWKKMVTPVGEPHAGVIYSHDTARGRYGISKRVPTAGSPFSGKSPYVHSVTFGPHGEGQPEFLGRFSTMANAHAIASQHHNKNASENASLAMQEHALSEAGSGFSVYHIGKDGAEKLATVNHRDIWHARSSAHRLLATKGGKVMIRDRSGTACGSGDCSSGKPNVMTHENALTNPWAGTGGDIEFQNITGSDDILPNDTEEEPRDPYQTTPSDEEPMYTRANEAHINEAMSRKHYKEVAAILKHEHDSAATPEHKEAIKRIGRSLASMFKADNPNFSHDRFNMAATGSYESFTNEGEPDFDEANGPDWFDDQEGEQLAGDGLNGQAVRQTNMGAVEDDFSDVDDNDVPQDIAALGLPNDPQWTTPADDKDSSADPLGDPEQAMAAADAQVESVDDIASLMEADGGKMHYLVKMGYAGEPSKLVFKGTWQEIADYCQANHMQRLYNRGSPYGFWFTALGDYTSQYWIDPVGSAELFGDDPNGLSPIAPGTNSNTPPAPPEPLDGESPAAQAPTGTTSTEIDPITSPAAPPQESVLLTFPKSRSKELVEWVQKAGGNAEEYTVSEDRFHKALATVQLPKPIADRMRAFLREDFEFVFAK